jgi:hypothetical protein
MTLRPRADGFRTEHPTSKRDNSILGSILACVAAAGCFAAPLPVAPHAGAGPAVEGTGGGPGAGGGNAGFFSDANPSEIGDAGGIDAGGNDGAAACAGPNPNGCSYPDEFATCPGYPAECVNGEWLCPFGVPCKDYSSDSAASDGGTSTDTENADSANDQSHVDMCESISTDYETALVKAKECTLGATQQCTKSVAGSFFCECLTFVNDDTDALASISASFDAAHCMRGCAGTCVIQVPLSCQVDLTSSTGARCLPKQPDGGT